MEKMQVFSGALGLGILRIWKHDLNEPPPLSPPSFNHTSSSGIAPPCQERFNLLPQTRNVGKRDFLDNFSSILMIEGHWSPLCLKVVAYQLCCLYPHPLLTGNGDTEVCFQCH